MGVTNCSSAEKPGLSTDVLVHEDHVQEATTQVLLSVLSLHYPHSLSFASFLIKGVHLAIISATLGCVIVTHRTSRPVGVSDT